jgi:hypothetical protein
LEDDFLADGLAAAKIKKLLVLLPKDWDLVYLGHSHDEKTCSEIDDIIHGECLYNLSCSTSVDFCKVKDNLMVLGAQAYLIRNKFIAKKLFITGSTEKQQKADTFIQNAKINRYMVFTNLFIQRRRIKADISKTFKCYRPLYNRTLEYLIKSQ